MRHNKREDSLSLLGRRVRALRDSLNLSQEQIHYATGISQPYLVKIEKGETNIGLRYISLLADFFGLEDYELLQYRSQLPDIETLQRGVGKFLKSNEIDPAIFFRKGIVHCLDITITNTRFLDTPKYSKEIADFLSASFGIKVSTSAVSQAMDGFYRKGVVEKLPTDKKSKFQYRKK